MSDYTKGPWILKFNEEYRCNEVVKEGRGVICDPCGDSYEEAKANGRLIAAAPELLETLKKLLGKVRCGSALQCSVCKEAEEVINKAIGGTNEQI